MISQTIARSKIFFWENGKKNMEAEKTLKKEFIDKVTVRRFAKENVGDAVYDDVIEIECVKNLVWDTLNISIIQKGFANHSRGIKRVIKAVATRVFFLLYKSFLYSLDDYQKSVAVSIGEVNGRLDGYDDTIKELQQENRKLKEEIEEIKKSMGI